MIEKQQAPINNVDIIDIIELVRPLAASQKKDILAAIDNAKRETHADKNIND